MEPSKIKKLLLLYSISYSEIRDIFFLQQQNMYICALFTRTMLRHCLLQTTFKYSITLSNSNSFKMFECLFIVLVWQSREAIKKLSEVAILIGVRNPYFTRKIKKLNKKLLELKTRLLVPTRVFYVRRLFLEHILISGNEINSSLAVLSRIIKSDKRIVRIKKFWYYK